MKYMPASTQRQITARDSNRLKQRERTRRGKIHKTDIEGNMTGELSGGTG